VKKPNMFHNYETEKITHKASDMSENLQLYRVVWFFRPRSLSSTIYILSIMCLEHQYCEDQVTFTYLILNLPSAFVYLLWSKSWS